MGSDPKPHEEEWQYFKPGGINLVDPERKPREYEDIANFCSIDGATLRDEARARLASAAPDMAKLLMKIERYARECVGCRAAGDNKRHEPNCLWVQIKEKAGLP